jgi:hypothetical protein
VLWQIGSHLPSVRVEHGADCCKRSQRGLCWIVLGPTAKDRPARARLLWQERDRSMIDINDGEHEQGEWTTVCIQDFMYT